VTERTDVVTFQGNPLTLVGSELAVGSPAPDATVLANDLSDLSISDTRGKVCLISVVPSLDTPVCDVQTRQFNEAAAAMGDGVIVLTVSMDLPFAQARWCGAAGVDRVATLSDHRDADFGTAFGVLIKELRLLARAVFVLDAEGVVRYAEIVPEMTDHPNYDAALAAAAELV
jgi:thioredoxin-dependent peroxiredoxin